jgi:putative ABC transport system permease protein
MFANVFRTAYRSLRRNRGFALLNVGGLALGLACVILITLYVQDERAFDRHHEHVDRIVRMEAGFVDDETTWLSMAQGLLAPSLEEQMPQVEAAARFSRADPVLRAHGSAHKANQVLFADPQAFDVFSLPLLEGDAETALVAPGALVLSESLAETLFGDGPAVGQTVGWKEQDLTVTAVMADVPRRSHLPFDALVSLSTLDRPELFSHWFGAGFNTYVLLREGASVEAFQAALPAFRKAVVGERADELAFRARPLADVYLGADLGGVSGDPETLRVLALVALFVLLVAVVNFVNLATARSVDRAREAGVRKVLGAARGGLAAQFLAEAVLLSLAGLAGAVVLAALALPFFQEVSGKLLVLADLGVEWAGLAALAVATGLLAGLYPAFVLSGFRPADVLRGRFATGRRGKSLRQGLVATQFAVSIALIAATSIVFAQLRHMQERDLGFDAGGAETQLVLFPLQNEASEAATLVEVRARLSEIVGVEGLAASLNTPTVSSATAGGEVDGPDGTPHEIMAAMYVADSSYASVYGLTFRAGRPARSRPEDAPVEYVLNETAVRRLGYAEVGDVLGATADFWSRSGTVVGVVQDFHIEGLQSSIRPLALSVGRVEPFGPDVLTARISTRALPSALAQIEAVWADAVPSRPFEYQFLDEQFAEQYVAERRFGRLFGAFSGLAILISCLGLFGLAAHAAAQRTKEIGVRRVLGASVAQVVALLSQNVVGLVALGGLVAAPVVWVGMSRWLDGFAYRIDLGAGPLVLAGLVVLAIALATVSAHALRAATDDPVRALRSE